MTDLVPAEDIERIVGVERHPTRHYARAVSAEETVYILHSHRCKDRGIDLRECLFSKALDKGIDPEDWVGAMDRPVQVSISRSGRLIGGQPGMRWTW